MLRRSTNNAFVNVGDLYYGRCWASRRLLWKQPRVVEHHAVPSAGSAQSHFVNGMAFAVSNSQPHSGWARPAGSNVCQGPAQLDPHKKKKRDLRQRVLRNQRFSAIRTRKQQRCPELHHLQPELRERHRLGHEGRTPRSDRFAVGHQRLQEDRLRTARLDADRLHRPSGRCQQSRTRPAAKFTSARSPTTRAATGRRQSAPRPAAAARR